MMPQVRKLIQAWGYSYEAFSELLWVRGGVAGSSLTLNEVRGCDSRESCGHWVHSVRTQLVAQVGPI